MELVQKGVSSEIIQQAFEEAEEKTDSRSVIRQMLEKGDL